MRLLNGSRECKTSKGKGRGTCTKGEYELETALWFYPIQDRQPFRVTPTSHRRGYFPCRIFPLQCACTFDLPLNSRGYHSVGLSPLTFLFLDEYFCWLSFWDFHEICCCYTKIYVVRGCGNLSEWQTARNQLPSAIMRTWVWSLYWFSLWKETTTWLIPCQQTCRGPTKTVGIFDPVRTCEVIPKVIGVMKHLTIRIKSYIFLYFYKYYF